jgi:hypothetical protein
VTGWEDELVVWELWSPSTGLKVANVKASMSVLVSIVAIDSAHLEATKCLTLNVTVNWSDSIALLFVVNSKSFFWLGSCNADMLKILCLESVEYTVVIELEQFIALGGRDPCNG